MSTDRLSDFIDRTAHGAGTGDHDSARATAIAESVARFGWIAKGLIFALIGVLGLELAINGYRGGDTDQRGALAALVQAPFGRILVVAVGVGLGLFALWQFWSAAVEPSDSLLDIAKRIGYAGLGAVYGMLAFSALRAGLFGADPSSGGSSGDSVTSPDGLSAQFFRLPGGRVVVAIIGIVTIAVGLYHLQKGWRRDFLDDIDTTGLAPWQCRSLGILGIAGFTARSAMLGIAGSLFVVAAWTYEADRAAGIDQSLRTLIGAPAGRVILAAAAAGLVAAGVYDALTYRRQELG